MSRPKPAIAYLDAPRLLRALSAGIGHVFQRREYLNRINVFPVPDGDTGTNMAFTFKTILEATASSPDGRVDELMDHVAEAALDGARGNSGAIMAQYFHGFREAVAGRRMLTAETFAQAAVAGAAAAWTAMSKPVQGTLPTVLDDFSKELTRRAADGVRDIKALVRHGLDAARESLAASDRAAQAALDMSSPVPVVGASGAVAACMGAFALRFTTRGVKMSRVAVNVKNNGSGAIAGRTYPGTPSMSPTRDMRSVERLVVLRIGPPEAVPEVQVFHLRANPSSRALLRQ